MKKYLSLQRAATTAFLALALLITSTVGSADLDDVRSCDVEDAQKPAEPWVANGGIALLIIVVVAMFWGLALVCEEYFVPALNVLCEEWKIPDDVAGATFMAAGASSPELFTAFIGLLAYKSNIGVGTVVGSEIFNHMIISAGSVIYAKDGVLQLDARTVCRDLFFYMLSLFLLIYSLKEHVFDAIGHTFDPDTWEDCLSVTLLHGLVLVIVYIVYAFTCAYYQRLVKCFCPPRRRPEDIDHAESQEEGRRSQRFNIFRQGQEPTADSHITSQGRVQNEIHQSKEMQNPVLDSRVPASPFVNGHFSTWLTDCDRLMKSALQGKATLQDIHPRIATRPTELLRAIRRKRQADIKSHKEARSAQDPAGGAASSSSSASARKESLRAPERTPEGVFSAISPMALPNKLMTEVDELQEARREYQKNYAEVGELETKTREYEVPEHLQIRGCRWFGLWLLDKLPPQDFATVERGEEVYKGWLYVYEDCIRLDSMPEWRTWQLRYFTISEHGLYSYDHPSEPCTGPHVQFVDLTTATEVAVYDQAKCVFAIRFHNEVLSDLQFRAANEDIMREMMQHISREIKRQEKRSEIEKAIYADAMKDLLWREIEEGEPGYHEHSLLEAPRGRYAFLWHIIVFPMKLAFHYTLVDCRTEGHRKYYGLIIALCTMYLGLMSYLMIFCCENIGDFLGTTPTVMGLTLSAIGTSFPNMWSSMVVARQGYGNMAISNALGSNIFNLDIALGLPWVVLLIVRDGEAYEEMKDHGIVLFILLLEIVCIIWICMIGFSGFTMRVWMAPVFLLLYVVVLTLCLTLG